MKTDKENPHLRFVVQKHRSTHLHYDLRLEMDGALRSWAVPKEPPLTEGVRRLAIAVEDHPLEYAHFSGVIPEGEYGAGTVEIWDEGIYIPKDILPDKVTAILYGKRMKGGYALIHTNQKNWILFKTKDAGTSASDGASARRK